MQSNAKRIGVAPNYRHTDLSEDLTDGQLAEPTLFAFADGARSHPQWRTAIINWRRSHTLLTSKERWSVEYVARGTMHQTLTANRHSHFFPYCVLFTLLEGLCGCAHTTELAKQYAPRSIRASAPAGPLELGAPYDRYFSPLPAEPLFPESRAKVSVVNEISHESLQVRDVEALRANARGWGVVSVTGEVDLRQRFATYRAYEISRVVTVDDATVMVNPPQGAAYYLWQIHLGHGYEEVVRGDASTFTFDAGVRFLSAAGGIGDFTQNSHLESLCVGHGLVPTTGKSIFARSPDEIQKSYSAFGPDVPIFVDYRQLPDAIVDVGEIPWVAPLSVSVAFRMMRVIEDGTWGSTLWTVDAFCQVNGRDVPVQNSKVWPEARVAAGQEYEIIWHETLSVVPGDQVACGTCAWLHDHVTSFQSGGIGSMAPVTIQRVASTSGTFTAGNAKGSYSINWALSVVR